MNANQRFVISSLLLSFVFLGCLFALLYVYDPLQLYHKPYFRETTFFNEMRIQDKGIIRNYDFNSFILGSSMFANTSAKEADEKIRFYNQLAISDNSIIKRRGIENKFNKWVNITVIGGTFNERAVIMRYLFRTKEVRHLVYSIDFTILGTNDTSSFEFLYDDNEINDLKLYINETYILCALTFSTREKCVGKDKNLDTLTNWAIHYQDSLGGIRNWLPHRDNKPINDTLTKLENITTISPYKIEPFDGSIESEQKNIRDNILYFTRKYPNTHFHLIIPTYSKLFYQLEPSAFYAQIKTILKWLVLETQNLPNVKIYGFDDLDYANDIASYIDATHYNVDMNSMQLDAIANGTHILTPENIDEYLQTMENKIKAYDLAPLIQEIKEWEKNQNDKK